MSNNVAILVNSCDKYEDAWEPFFRLLKIQWPRCENYKIFLGTEEKSYNCDFLQVETINIRGKVSWSERLRKTLEKIDTEYVLFFLEDFFLLEKVRNDIFLKSLELMENDEKIGLITFNKRRYGAEFPETTDYEKCFRPLGARVKNRTNVLVGLWRREYFLSLIYGDESPWEYEKNSNIRSRFAGYKIYTQDYDFSPAAFRYCMNPEDGYGITQGKWLPENKKLFEDYGIFNVNYDNLGFFEKVITYEEIQMESREYREKLKAQQKLLLKNERATVRFKEYLYNICKSLRKSAPFQRLEYLRACVKYFIYYKL